jgi:hypothetical protein
VAGASYLVHQVGTEWVTGAAVRAGTRVRVVLAISGKALLLVDDQGAGQAVIAGVSERALEQAPGLEVTGVAGPGFDSALEWRLAPAGVPDSGVGRPFTHVEALERTYELLEAVRQSRPSPLLRDPLLPWFEVCRDSGYPAAGVERHADLLGQFTQELDSATETALGVAVRDAAAGGDADATVLRWWSAAMT